MAEVATLRQSSFSGGLLSPQLLGRVDLQKYQSGWAVLRNFVVTRNGSVENRAGTIFVSNVKNSASPVRLVKFDSSTNQGILLEMGNLYIRFWKNGASVGILPAPAPQYNNATAYLVGAIVQNGSDEWFRCAIAGTGNGPFIGSTFWTLMFAGNGSAWGGGVTYPYGCFVQYPLFSGIYYFCVNPAGSLNNQPDISPGYWYRQPSINQLELPTSIPQAALANLQVAQIQDLMFIANQLFTPQQMTHLSDTNWTIAALVPTTGIGTPTNAAVAIGVPPAGTIAAPTGLMASGGGGGLTSDYAVTAFKNGVGESPPAVVNSHVAPGVTLTWNAVAGADGYLIYLGSSFVGPFYLIGIVEGATTFTDGGLTPASAVRAAPGASGSNTAFSYVVTAISSTTGLESFASAPATGNGSTPTPSAPNVITWTAVPGAATYNIYSIVNGVPGFIGQSATTTFNDTNITPATSKQPPVNIPQFQTSNDYPAVVGAFQGRLIFGNTVNQPQSVWASSSVAYYNFTTALPVIDSAAFTFTIAGKVRQFVQGIVDIGKLVIITSAGEYVAPGNFQNGAVTPTADQTVLNGSAGGALLPAVTIGTTCLYVQARGNIIRDMRYSIYTTTYTGKDTTLYAPQLFEGQQIVQLDWQQIYNSIVWCVQSNGAFLGMTYIIDQDMWAWHQHDTYGGFIEQVCVVPEGANDTLYMVVRRTILGVTQRSIERVAIREFQDLQNLTDAIFTDCSLTFDGRNTSQTTITSTTGANWTPNDVITLTSSAPAFGSLTIGNAVVLRQIADGSQLAPVPDGSNPSTLPIPYPVGYVIDQVVFTILTMPSSSQITATPNKNVPTWAQGFGLTTWGLMANTFSGMTQLAGQAINIQGDGAVVANALTDTSPTVVSSAGVFTTKYNYLVLTAGLPIIGQLQTLPRDSGGRSETLMNKQQLMMEATAMFYNTRGGYWGPDFDHLFEWDQRGLQFEPMGSVPALFTGPVKIPLMANWETTGQVCIQQTDPLPMSLSAIAGTGYSAQG